MPRKANPNSPINRLKAWSKAVRSGGKCEVCGGTSKLNAHHILDKKLYPAYKYEPLNGVALCCSCHSKYGIKGCHNKTPWHFFFWLTSKPEQFYWVQKIISNSAKNKEGTQTGNIE